MKNIINLTPHAVVLLDSSGNVTRRIEPAPHAARVSSTVRTVGEVDGIPVTETTFGEVEGLPGPQEGTIYIVSLLVMQQVAHTRTDTYRPDTGPQSVVRDAKGVIVGVRALTRS